MLEITSLNNGLVIDHIEAGMGIKIFNYLNLDQNTGRAALIMNAESKQYGRKDIIKFEKEDTSEVDYTILAMFSPRITVDEVKNGKIVNKIKPELPEKVENILKCKNPRCITVDEKYVPHSFILIDREKATYRCEYCDSITRLSNI